MDRKGLVLDVTGKIIIGLLAVVIVLIIIALMRGEVMGLLRDTLDTLRFI